MHTQNIHKYMNYTEFSDFCEKQGILVKSVLSSIEMTYSGIKTALDSQSISAKKLIKLCEALKISPNYFFGIPDSTEAGLEHNYLKQQIEILNKVIEMYNVQLKKKDEQIETLHEIMKAKQQL